MNNQQATISEVFSWYGMGLLGLWEAADMLLTIDPVRFQRQKLIARDYLLLNAF